MPSYRKLTPLLTRSRRFYVALALLTITGCGAPAYEQHQGQTMGTYYSVTFLPSEICQPDPATWTQALVRINDVMSTYQDDSELSLFNEQPEDLSLPVSEELLYVMRAAADIHTLTFGAFDVTVGPLVNLWGFGPERVEGRPSEAAIAAARQRVGMDKLTIGADSLTKSVPGLYVDLSALAKGYGVDALAALLERAQCDHYMVDIGGEIRVAGNSPRGAAWRVGIEVPQAEAFGQLHGVLELSNVAVATSGDYRNFRVIDGERVDHVIDPRSGTPADNNVVSVTVIHEQAMYADAFATALMVLGAEAGIALAQAQGFAAYIISRQTDNDDEASFAIRYTDLMRRYLVELPVESSER